MAAADRVIASTKCCLRTDASASLVWSGAFETDEQRARCPIVGLRLLPQLSGRVGGSDADRVASAAYANKPWRASDNVRAQALLDRSPTDRLAEESLDGAVDVARSHGVALIHEHTDDGVQDPIVPTMLRRDRTAGCLGVALPSIFVAVPTLRAVIRAAFEQGFQGSRRVGMASG